MWLVLLGELRSASEGRGIACMREYDWHAYHYDYYPSILYAIMFTSPNQNDIPETRLPQSDWLFRRFRNLHYSQLAWVLYSDTADEWRPYKF